MSILIGSFLISLRERRLYPLYLAGAVGISAISISAAIAEPPISQPLPTISEEVGAVQVMLPDWDNISFSTLPAVLTGGEIGSAWNELVGYDLSRIWSEGDAVGDVVKLGDIADGFSAQEFSLNDIAGLSDIGVSMDDLPLSSFGLVGDQSLVELVTAMPELATMKIEDIPPINDLVSLVGEDHWSAETLGAFVNGNTIAAELKLGGLDELTANLDLSQYPISDIPGLSDMAIEEFARWDDQFPSDIPGLVDVAFSQMPNGIGNAGVIARVDTVMGDVEAEYNRTVSGSTEVGFAYPCNKDTQGGDTKACAHIELDDIENFGDSLQLPFEGRAWVSGVTQKVAGGHGALKALFGGKEPTGRHPFSDSFKVVIGETDETTDTFQTLLYFRVCKAFLGCSPYGIGPVPFLTFKRDDYIILGPPNFGGGSGSIGSSTSPANASGGLNAGAAGAGGIVNNGVETIGAASETLSSSGDSSAHSSISTNGSGSSHEFVGLTAEDYAQQSGIAPLACTGEEVDGINLEVLGDAIAQELGIPDGYQGVSASTGKAVTLGRYGYLSTSQWVQDWVSRVAGGPDWLAQLANGHVPSRLEMEQYFPRVLQDEIFKAEMRSYFAIATEEVDPQTVQGFKGSRLVERVAQLSFGGVGSVIDSTAKGQGPSLYRYGVRVRNYYYGQGGQSQCSISFIRQEGSDG